MYVQFRDNHRIIKIHFPNIYFYKSILIKENKGKITEYYNLIFIL